MHWKWTGTALDSHLCASFMLIGLEADGCSLFTLLIKVHGVNTVHPCIYTCQDRALFAHAFSNISVKPLLWAAGGGGLTGGQGRQGRWSWGRLRCVRGGLHQRAIRGATTGLGLHSEQDVVAGMQLAQMCRPGKAWGLGATAHMGLGCLRKARWRMKDFSGLDFVGELGCWSDCCRLQGWETSGEGVNFGCIISV